MKLFSKKSVLAIGLLAIAGAVGFWVLTAPDRLSKEDIAALPQGDLVAGENVFWVSGCASCHAEKGAKGDDKLLLGGRHPLVTPFGTFYAPNISPDPETGIGNWSLAEFTDAMKNGVSPEGSHYYPSFPYGSYTRMTNQDIADLWAYMQTLAPVRVTNLDHDLALPFKLRRGIGLWKLLYLDDAPRVELASDDPVVIRGQYLAEGPAHCGECHTPRNLIGGFINGAWMAGGPAPEGKGFIPNISPHETGIGSWSASDIAYSLESGFTPEFDSFGSTMVSVQENMANARAEDREAIAAYLKAIPARPATTR